MSTQSIFLEKFDNWKKFGRIVLPNFKKKWMKSHLAVPFADKISQNKIKLYFCVRDKLNRSHIVSKNMNLKNIKCIKEINSKIELYPGRLGEFDETGVTPTWLLDIKKKKYLYYVGWRPAGSVRLSLFVGLAIKHKKTGKFKKIGNFPLLERSNIDPFLTATLSILKERNIFKMWYVSGDGWIKKDKNQTIPKYNIKYAESLDGINWKRKGKVCINYKSKKEHAIARPSVIKLNKYYYMWYCFKSVRNNYKIGFAFSKNGIDWKRLDKFCNSLNNKRLLWENEMLAYPHVIKKNNELIMLYNGNGYGESGIGLAKLNINFLNK